MFDELAPGAERVRWALDAIPWHEVDLRVLRRTSEPWCARWRSRRTRRIRPRSASSSRSSTISDLSQWISVWFYEETRHPHVLIEWLRRVGEPVSSDFVVKGRVSTPFMRSVIGTLTTNVISEVTAQAYRRLARSAPEPVLARLARLIAGDEARHASSFFRFARKHLGSATPDAARRDCARGLEVLQAWLPPCATRYDSVAQMMDRLKEAATSATSIAGSPLFGAA